MQPSPGPAASPPGGGLLGLSPIRLALAAGLLALLLAARWYEDAVYAGLEALLAGLGRLLPAAAALPGSAAGGVRGLMERPHSVPAALLYAGGYVALSWALLATLLPPGQGWRWGLRLYGGLGLASALLLALGHGLGLPILSTLASRLLHLLLSPLPIMVLVPLLRWPGGRAAA